MTWWQRVLRRGQVEKRLTAELRDHFERLVADHVARGMSPFEATRLARLEFGGFEHVKEECRDALGTRWLHDAVGDVAYALRQGPRAPGVAIFSLAVLAIGIGVSLALFGLFDALALRVLPLSEPDRLLSLQSVSPARPGDPGSVPTDALGEVRRRQGVFAAITGYAAGGLSMLDEGRPVQHGVVFAGSEYFETFGVQPSLGRLLGAGDASAQVVVLSDDFWRRRYNRDGTIVGQIIRLEDKPFTIIGVSAPGFVGLEPHSGVDFFLPIAAVGPLLSLPPDFPVALTRAVGRLKPGVSVVEARRELAVLWPGVLAAIVPPDSSGVTRTEFLSRRLEVVPASRGFSDMRDWYASPLQMLAAATVILLLVMCANLAGLVWTRTLGRQRELNVRIALGASPGRITRQLLTETLTVTTAGTVIALPIAWMTSRALVAFMWNDPVVPPFDITPGWRFYVAAALCALMTGIALGVLPAWRTFRAAHGNARLAASAPTQSTKFTGELLVIAQIVIAVLLLIGQGLITRSLLTLRDHRAGFDTGGIQMASLLPRSGATPTDVGPYLHGLVDRVSTVPGVSAAALSIPEPLMGMEAGEERLPVSASDGPDAIRIDATVVLVSPGFFDVMGVPLLRGRDLSWTDSAPSPVVALLSSTGAHRLFPDGDALGRAIRVGFAARHQRVEVVGIVADARLADLHTDEPLFVFFALSQHPNQSPSVVLRAHPPARTLGPSLRTAVESLGHDFVVAHRTLDDQVAISLLRERLMALGARWFGAMALVLVVAGVAGLLSQFVTQRTREVGIRVALGASPGSIRTMVVGRTLALTSIGLAIGLPVAVSAAPLLTHRLTAVSPTDATTLLLVPSLMLAMALAAAWAPVRRATRISPAEVLKSE